MSAVVETTGSSASSDPASPASRAPDWAILAIACLGQFMVVLDVSIVNVALPSIHNELGFSESGLQWVVNAYTIVFAGFLLLGGRAADLFGQRRLFMIGLSLFTGASLVGGFAQSQGMLIGARAAQGLGGAVLSPATLTILTTTFRDPAARTRALGAWSAVAGGGGAAGALAGGILTDLISWRWILFVNVPIGVIGLVVARLVIPETRNARANHRIDVPGAFLITGGLTALVAGIVQSDSHGWSSVATLAPSLGGLGLIGFFLVYQAGIAPDPLVPLRLFRSRPLAVANGSMFFLASAVFASWYFLTLYLQGSLGYSPLAAGFAFLPQTVGIILGAQVSSRLVGRIGPRPPLVAGCAVSAIGLAWLSFIPTSGSYVANLMVPGVLATLGIGLAMTPLALSATSGMAREDAGFASGLINAMRQIGGSLGLAVLATIAIDHTRALRLSGHAAKAAVVSGYSRAFAVSAGFAVVAGLIALALPTPGRPLPVADDVAEAAAPAAREPEH
ncbi:MAG: MFS transporter [Frankia sp.]